jgi:uncharacterized protein
MVGKHSHLFLAFALFVTLLACSRQQTKTYWENGNIQSHLNYNKNGELEGLASWYYASGQLQQEAFYVQNQLHGKMLRYHENGRLESVAWYKNNLRDSIFVQYDFRGNKIAVENFRNDTLHGLYYRYYNDGTPMIEGEYAYGALHGIWLFHDAAGLVIGRGEYSYGNGTQKAWYLNGKLQRTIEYKNNLQHGPQVHYLPDGRIEKTVYYEFGEAIREEIP